MNENKLSVIIHGLIKKMENPELKPGHDVGVIYISELQPFFQVSMHLIIHFAGTKKWHKLHHSFKQYIILFPSVL